MNRRATVHDLTTLALHPTGSRARAGQTNAIQDARGNWIARDAGGRGVVAKRPRLRPGDVSSEDEDEEAQERYDLTEADVLSEARNDNGPWTSRHGRATVRVQSDINAPKDERARKRHKFVHDVDFLENFTSAQKTQKSDLPNPSSDLLKHIHHFASHYYTSQNLLFDSSREYRSEKKQRKLVAEVETSHEKPDNEDNEEDDEEDDEEDEEEEDSNEFGASKKKASNVKGEGKTKKNKEGKKKHLQRDMYKVLDGSALVAIGMLLQHHTASLLQTRIPHGWEDEMELEMEHAGGEGIIPRGGKRRRRGNVQIEVGDRREEEEESEMEADVYDETIEAGIREEDIEEEGEGSIEGNHGSRLSGEGTDETDVLDTSEDDNI